MIFASLSAKYTAFQRTSIPVGKNSLNLFAVMACKIYCYGISDSFRKLSPSNDGPFAAVAICIHALLVGS